MTRAPRWARLISGPVVATVLAGFAIVMISQTPANARERDPGHRRPTTHLSGLSHRSLPAPPRPRKTRPDQRIVTPPRDKASTQSPKGQARSSESAAPVGTSGKGAFSSSKATTLVLYDSTGAYGWLGEAYGMLTANLVSHFGGWTAHPVNAYTAGEISSYSAIVYIGSTYDGPIPTAFLDDVLLSPVPVIWIYDNIWELTARQSDFSSRWGFLWQQFDFANVTTIRYKDTALSRDAMNAAGIMNTTITDPTKARVLAEAVRADGTSFPWAVRSGNLTYIGEIPLSYITHGDRYLAFADLLFDALAPTTPVQRRALVRIEDVGPDSDPATLRSIADYLFSQRIPFTVAVYPRYRDPRGVNNGGKATEYSLKQKPLVVSALKYMRAKGGTLLMHGYTHQFSNINNPYDGVSGNDFEFYLTHIDENNNVIYDGPVPGDSVAYVQDRVKAGLKEFRQAGLPQPTIFEFPHYAGSMIDYLTIADTFSVRYDRGLYFSGTLSATTIDYTRIVGQFFPYTVRDIYGSVVIPENIGNIEPEPFNNHPARLPADVIASARDNLVIRDSIASFFYHPYLGTTYLQQVVEGVRNLGYTFVPASATVTS